MVNFKSLLLTGCLSGLALAAPSATVKRAAVDDTAPGFASLNGGTKGGAGGTTTTVSSYAAFTEAVSSDDAKVVIVKGNIKQEAKQVKIGSNTSIIGQDANAVLEGFGVLVKKKENVIIRNLGVKKVLADYGDAIGVQYSNNVWIDHCDVSSDRDHDKDYYDGLIDLTHAADYVTVSNTFVHDHWKAVLIGHSDSNSDEDTGHLRITLNNNYLYNLNSRGPSFRFGTGHIYNNYYEDVSDGINTRQGAQLLVESNQFVGSKKPLYSTDGGYAVAKDNDFGDGENTADEGKLTSVEYKYDLLGSGKVKSAVVGTAGQTLTF
ncbi:hypothetical protein ASPWEDRAFT_52110 [Aspergillus wentii DTO 134E9]|uniref:pectate lyase n=1 Tax=Aspergillus wentii DTO 134E9 TaxID=1073089 RepID=A0A1L9RFJ0_ASPWE|nr:uncharacterized protein ASPWEDRAFT_52110 [Aspergillus wentii DTO 134E9]KAI9925442.1 hypothetical protein MW887_005823 [Aspergillus wentii]OJJ33674.1 hypothetical protein ASPWEDRAFT_52110 [Aspergillus wentii DTO 134E9]